MTKLTRLPRRWQVLLVVSIAVFMSSLDLFIVNIAFPAIRADFEGSSLASVSWVLNAYAIVFAALLVPAGRWADRIGRRRVFVAGVALFTAASALCALATNVETLVAARVLQGAGAAALMPTSLALLLPEFPPHARAMAVGAWAAVGAAAAAAGPPVGGLLVELSWHWVFLVNLPIGLVTIALAFRVLRETRDPVPGPRPDLVGAALLSAAVAGLTLALVQGPEWGWDDGRTLAAFAGAALLVGAFVLRSSRHPAPVVELSILRVRSFAMANLGALLFFAAFGAMLLAGVSYLTQVWGHSVLRAGFELAPGPAMATIFALTAGRLTQRVGQRALAVTGSVVFACGVVWWTQRVGPTPAYATAYLPGMMLTGTGVGLVLPSLSSAAAASLPPARFATGTGVFSMSRQIGGALGVAAFVAILGTPSPAEAGAAFDRVWWCIAAAALGAGAAAGALGRLRVAAPAPAPASAPVPVEVAA
jgi:EmrB/QacA subfamily drug resistance transporter